MAGSKGRNDWPDYTTGAILNSPERIRDSLTGVDINETISNILRMFKRRIDTKGLQVELHLDEQVPEIKADQLKLEQALINLIDNAVKYTDQGRITILSRVTENYVIIEVQDTGIGIPEKHLHWLALLGGFPGGWLGRFIFHHKTRKRIFFLVLVISTIIHLGLAGWLFFK